MLSAMTKRTLLDWTDACRANRHGLTRWELDFLDSIAERLEQGWTLSNRQVEVLERMRNGSGSMPLTKTSYGSVLAHAEGNQ